MSDRPAAPPAASAPTLGASLARFAVTPAGLTALAVALGGAAILAALGFQHLGGYLPCKLCLEQRQPYYIGLPLAGLALVLLLRRRALPLAALLLLAVAAAFAWGSGLGVYQAGAEWGFWEGPTDCGGGGAIPQSATGMLDALRSVRVVSCTEASWRFAGLSFAGWNAVVSAAVAGAALAAAAGTRRLSARPAR